MRLYQPGSDSSRNTRGKINGYTRGRIHGYTRGMIHGYTRDRIHGYTRGRIHGYMGNMFKLLNFFSKKAHYINLEPIFIYK